MGLFWSSLELTGPPSGFPLSISDQRVESVAVNGSGDWIALGCSGPSLLGGEDEAAVRGGPRWSAVVPRSDGCPWPLALGGGRERGVWMGTSAVVCRGVARGTHRTKAPLGGCTAGAARPR